MNKCDCPKCEWKHSHNCVCSDCLKKPHRAPQYIKPRRGRFNLDEFNLDGATAPAPTFSWGSKKRLPAISEAAKPFVEKLPPTALRHHLGVLVDVYIEALKLDPNVAAPDFYEKHETEILLFEHIIKEIAAFTRLDAGQARRIVEAQRQRQAQTRVRREFKKKEK